MPASRTIRIAALALALSNGCGDKPPEADSAPSQKTAPEAIARRGPYTGTLPCADCSGIQTELSLFAMALPNTPGIYHLRQTYLGTHDGDRTLTSMGRWKEQKGSPSDPNATLIVLDFNKPDEQRSFVQAGADELRLLDRSQAAIQSTAPHRLVRASGATPAATLVAGEHARPVVLHVGEEIIVQLPANRSTGFTWALADSASGAVAWQSDLYVQDTTIELAVGVGGNEYLRFRAVQPGAETLHFEYRRPWEQRATPARSATLQITVQ